MGGSTTQRRHLRWMLHRGAIIGQDWISPNTFEYFSNSAKTIIWLGEQDWISLNTFEYFSNSANTIIWVGERQWCG